MPSSSLQDSCELAAHASGLGVAGISAMPPFFFKVGFAMPHRLVLT